MAGRSFVLPHNVPTCKQTYSADRRSSSSPAILKGQSRHVHRKSRGQTRLQSFTAERCRHHQHLARLVSCSAAAEAPATTSAAAKLVELDLVPIINLQGLIQPDVPEGTQASVFAIFDEGKKLQFVGFSKDLRNSLRTVFSRRPDKAFFYKAWNLQQLDQNEMLAIRTAWFEEVGGPPTGNKLALERKAWSEPVDAGAISARGRLQAAEGKVTELMGQIKLRGCKEEFVPDPAQLQEGKVDFLAAAAFTPEELERQKQLALEAAKATRTVTFTLDSEPAEFELRIRRAFKTNGGMMFDLSVSFEDKETVHRVIVGRDYYEDFGMEAKDVLALTFAFLLRKKVPRQTEGMLLSSQFNINYFAISEVDQWFTDFQEEWATTGKKLEGEGKFWRMNRLHDYGQFGSENAKGREQRDLMLGGTIRAA